MFGIGTPSKHGDGCTCGFIRRTFFSKCPGTLATLGRRFTRPSTLGTPPIRDLRIEPRPLHVAYMNSQQQCFGCKRALTQFSEQQSWLFDGKPVPAMLYGLRLCTNKDCIWCPANPTLTTL